MDYHLFDRLSGTRKKHDGNVRALCQECAVHCGLIAYLSKGTIVDLHGDDEHPISRGRLCARGRAFIQGLDHPARITSPLFRRSLRDPFAPLEDGEKALDLLADRLRKIKDQSGPESIIILCDLEHDPEFALGAARFAALFDIPQIYQPTDSGGNLPEYSRSGISPPSCTEWKQSRSLLLIEADPATTHPVAFSWALEARQRGSKLIAADSRFTRTMSKADTALRINPHRGNVLGLALMKTALESSSFDDTIIKTRFLKPGEWQASFERLSWEELERILGLSRIHLNKVIERLTHNQPITIISGEKLADLPGYGIWPTFMTAMGWGGEQGGGWYPLRGCFPSGLPENQKSLKFMSLAKLRQKSNSGRFPGKALIYSGDGPADFFRSSDNPTQDPELTVCFGAFPNAGWDQTSLFFPSTLWAEKTGLCLNIDRMIQWTEKIKEPPRDCRSGLDFWAGLAKRFGWAGTFPGIGEDGSFDREAFYQTILDGNTLLKGLSLDQLKEAKGETVVRLRSIGAGDGDGKMNPTDAPDLLENSSPDQDREHFPLVHVQIPFVTRSKGMGSYWDWTRPLETEDTVQIHPETAGILRIENGEAVMLAGPGKTFSAQAWITRMVPPGMAASPYPVDGDRVLIHKKDQTAEEAFTLWNSESPNSETLNLKP